ncbi:MAG: biotin/lipoyl-containing protein, partial [Nitriliruptor sp.]
TAIDRLLGSVRATVGHGVVTNLELLAAILDHPAHRDGDLTTSFLDDHLGGWAPDGASTDALDVAALAVLRGEGGRSSPGWPSALGPLRIGGQGGPVITLHDRDQVHRLRVAAASDGSATPPLTVTGDDGVGRCVRVRDVTSDGTWSVDIDGRPVSARVTTTRDADGAVTVWVHTGGRTVSLQHEPVTRHLDDRATVGEGSFASPMPGSLIAAPVAVGEHVAAGTTLLVVEAMKMEHPIAAPVAGTLTALHVGVGDAVDAGTPLLSFTPDTDEEAS